MLYILHVSANNTIIMKHKWMETLFPVCAFQVVLMLPWLPLSDQEVVFRSQGHATFERQDQQEAYISKWVSRR